MQKNRVLQPTPSVLPCTPRCYVPVSRYLPCPPPVDTALPYVLPLPVLPYYIPPSPIPCPALPCPANLPFTIHTLPPFDVSLRLALALPFTISSATSFPSPAVIPEGDMPVLRCSEYALLPYLHETPTHITIILICMLTRHFNRSLFYHLHTSSSILQRPISPILVDAVHRVRGKPRFASRHWVTVAGWPVGCKQAVCTGGSTLVRPVRVHPGDVHSPRITVTPYPISHSPGTQPGRGHGGHPPPMSGKIK